MKPFLSLSQAVAVVAVLCIAGVSHAQSVQWVDTGVLRSTDRGEGVEIRFQSDQSLPKGKEDEILTALCATYAARAVPFVVSKFPNLKPQFVSIRVKTSSSLLIFRSGQYWSAKYEWSDGACGSEIE